MNNMKERPILMSTEMVQAILEQRKTQTRRLRGLEVINASPNEYAPESHYIDHEERFSVSMRQSAGIFPPRAAVCDYGKPGDILWVRETFLKATSCVCWGTCRCSRYHYKATTFPQDSDKWRPSIHMPKDASRIWLKVTDIQLERLHNISTEDAIAEGIQPLLMSSSQELQYGKLFRDYSIKVNPTIFHPGISAFKSYRSLWIKLNGLDSYVFNPWVWKISFNVLSTTGRPESFHQLTSAS